MNEPKYILLGGNGYFGRNFQYYLSKLNKYFIVIDKNEIDYKFYSIELIKNHLIQYLQHDLNNKIDLNNIDLNKDDKIIIINFAAISFVDYSILHPEETINNNLNCCINGYKLFMNLKLNSLYIYISTDEVNVNKKFSELSPYVISKRKCEDFLKSLNNSSIIIYRPVNLMDVIDPMIKELKQKNKCLLNKIVDVILNKSGCVQIHGTGEQKRMFMTILNACYILYNINANGSNGIKIIDVTLTNKRTCDLKIKDIVLYLKNIYNFEIEYVKDPRSIYQDETYLKSNNLLTNSYEDDLILISKVIERLIK